MYIMKMGELTRQFVLERIVPLLWSEQSRSKFERNVPEESSREELVLERTVPEPFITAIKVRSLLHVRVIVLKPSPSYEIVYQ